VEQLLKKTRRLLLNAASSAATTTIESTVVDMANFQGVVITTDIATANAGNVVKVQQGSLANGSDMTDLAGSATANGTNGNAVVIDVYKPTKRYIRAVVVRGASTAVGPIHAELYDPRNKVVSHGSTIVAKSLVSPLEGTA
jgi:hypothetical protein